MGDELYASTETDNIKRVDPKNLKGFDEEYRYLGSLVLKLLPTENRFYRNIKKWNWESSKCYKKIAYALIPSSVTQPT